LRNTILTTITSFNLYYDKNLHDKRTEKAFNQDPFTECPDWYSEAWEKGNYPIPDALKRAGYRDDDDKPETEENGSPAQETEEQNGSAHENGESSNTVRAYS